MGNAIAIVDYGVGNLRSVQKALEHEGFAAVITSERRVIAEAPAVILPGVGAFGAAMSGLKTSGLTDVVREAAWDGRPFLGICLGLQVLFEASEEAFTPGLELEPGLGVLPGIIRRFPQGLKVPQIGWNTAAIRQPDHPLLSGVADGSYFYFVHSYYAVPADERDVLSSTEYGVPFASAVARGSLAAFQFHPEKSGSAGLRILANFGARATNSSTVGESSC